jgi:hypothetical protein
MLLRLRWMGLGVMLALWLSVLVATRLVRARQRFTPAHVRRTAAAMGADGLASAADRLRRAPQAQG